MLHLLIGSLPRCQAVGACAATAFSAPQPACSRRQCWARLGRERSQSSRLDHLLRSRSTPFRGHARSVPCAAGQAGAGPSSWTT